MKTEAKKNLLAASLYVALAVTIVTVVCVTVLTVAKKAKESLPAPAVTENTAPAAADPSAPSQNTAPTDVKDEPSGEQSTEPSSEEEKVDAPAPDPLPANYVLPAKGYISKGYEPDLPVWSTTMEDYRIHDGIDIVCDSDAEIYACADGTVESIYEDPLMGYCMTVYHGGGLRSTYMGLTGEYPPTIATGVNVTEGQLMGWIGESALIECAEPKHLHFVMTLDEETVDPQNYIQFESATMNEYE